MADSSSPTAAGASAALPWFSVTMTVRNNAATIRESLASILPDLGTDGELVIVDARSTDGTWEYLEELMRADPRVRATSQACNRGLGRNLAAAAARGAILLTQVDGDNRYASGIVAATARATRDTPDTDVTFAVGLEDWDPSTSRFYAWKTDSFRRTGRYPNRQEVDDPPLLLSAFRHGLRARRLAVPHVAWDLKPRPARWAAGVGPWRRARHSLWAARRFRVIGFRLSEFIRLLWLTRRTDSRFVVGVGVAVVGYAVGALRRDGEATLSDPLRPLHPPPPTSPPGPPHDGAARI